MFCTTKPGGSHSCNGLGSLGYILHMTLSCRRRINGPTPTPPSRSTRSIIRGWLLHPMLTLYTYVKNSPPKNRHSCRHDCCPQHHQHVNLCKTMGPLDLQTIQPLVDHESALLGTLCSHRARRSPHSTVRETPVLQHRCHAEGASVPEIVLTDVLRRAEVSGRAAGSHRQRAEAYVEGSHIG